MQHQGIHPLHDLIFAINKPLIGKKGVHYQKLLKDWSKIVGEDLARYTIPTKISSFKRSHLSENILYLATNNAAASTELVYHVGVIKERINIYFGYPYIQQIKLVQASFEVQSAPKEQVIKLLPETIVKIDNLTANYDKIDEIKESLKNLAASILSKKFQ